jgi:hypothetical protein
MDRFIEFDQDVSLEDLQLCLDRHNPGIMLLRYSKLTGTVKVRVEANLSKKDIKRAFDPFKVKQIHTYLPYDKET